MEIQLPWMKVDILFGRILCINLNCIDCDEEDQDDVTFYSEGSNCLFEKDDDLSEYDFEAEASDADKEEEGDQLNTRCFCNIVHRRPV